MGLKQGTLAAVLGIVALPSLVIFRGSDGHVITKDGRLDVNVRACKNVRGLSKRAAILCKGAKPCAASVSFLGRASVLMRCRPLQPSRTPLEIHSRWKTSANASSSSVSSVSHRR